MAGTTIGELLVKITGSETGLTTAINNSETAVKRLGTTTEETAKGSGFQSIFQGVGLGVGLFALNAITTGISDVTGAISDSITISEDDQVALTKLSQAMKDAGVAGDGMASALVDARQSGVDLGFTIKDLTDAQALLITGTKSVANANVALQAAEDLARLKGVDLGTAVTAVNKLFNGSATAITRMGIAIPKGVSGLQAIADLEKAAGGQAQAFADTTAGAVDVMDAKWNELQGKIGNDLIPAFLGLVDAMDGVVSEGNAISDTIDVISGKSQDAAGAIKEQQSSSDELGHSILGVLFPALQVQAQVSDAVSKAAQDAIRNTQLIGGAASGVGQDILSVASTTDDAATQVGTAWSRAADAVGTAAAKFPSILETPTQKAHDAIVALMGKTPGDLVAALQGGYNAISNESQSLADALKHPMTLAAREAKLNGELHDKNLIEGLKSKDPLIKAQAEQLRSDIETQMQQLEADAPGYGLGTAGAYANALGGAEALAEVKRNAKALAAAAKSVMEAFSPPGPESPLHDIDKWGLNTGLAWADGLAKGIGSADPAGAMAKLGFGGGLTPGIVGSDAMAAVGSPLAGTTIVVQVGNEKLAEITDRQLFQQRRIYAPGIPSQTLGAPTR